MTQCKFCNSTAHSYDRCFERMQIDSGGRCPRCDAFGHSWRICTTAQQAACGMCESQGRVTETCFHLRKVINCRQAQEAKRQSVANLDENWSKNKEEKRKLFSVDSSTSLKLESSEHQTMSDATNESSGSENGSEEETLFRTPPQSSGRNHLASMTIDPNGNITIEASPDQLMEILVIANSLKQKSTMAASASSQDQKPIPELIADAFSSLSLSSTGSLTRDVTETIANEQIGTVNIHNKQSSNMTQKHAQDTGSLNSQSDVASDAPASVQESQSVKPKVVKTPTSTSSTTASVSTDASLLGTAGPLSGDYKSGRRFVEGEPFLTEQNYIETLQLYENDLWPTFTPFACPNCSVLVDTFEGVVLKNCQVHKTCRECLRTRILNSPVKEVTCPQYAECMASVTELEIFELLSDEMEKESYRKKPFRIDAENNTSNLQVFLLDHDILPNLEAFECPVCLEKIPALEGVIPKNCGEHKICRECLRGAINNSDSPLVNCPAEDCDAQLQDREVQLLTTPENYQAFLKKGLQRALTLAMRCMTPNCNGAWFISSEGNGRFLCEVCNKVNCSKCKVIHEEEQTCEAYQADLAIRRQNEVSENESKAYLEQRLKDGFAMICPKCNAIVEKTDGCDGILCTVCRTELCWATKGLRWGPGGKGDWVGGGCRCWVNGQRCAPHCHNCH